MTSDRRPRPADAAWVLLGVATGLLIVLPASTVTTPAPLLAIGVATTCYVAAAAVGARWASWAAVPAGTAAVTLGELLPVGPRWSLLVVLAVAVAAWGLCKGRRATVAQSVAMAGFLGAGSLGLLLAPAAGLAVAGVALGAHAAWDWSHCRRDVVVARSMAVWCIGLDLTAGAVCVAAALLV
jgi:hypothetical protein